MEKSVLCDNPTGNHPIMVFSTLLNRIISTRDKLTSIENSCNGSIDQDILKDALNTEQLAELACDLIYGAKLNLKAMHEAVEEIERCQTDSKESDKHVIDLQNKLLTSNSNQQEKFAEQIKTFSDVVTSVPTQITKTVKQAVMSTVKKVGTERNVIIFGVEESPEEDLAEIVEELFLAINFKLKFEAARIGIGSKRPVKVMLENANVVSDVLRAAKNLNGTEEYCNVYITVDRSIEERASRKKLVLEMKQKISEDPSKHYYIRGGQVCYSNRSKENDSDPSVGDVNKNSKEDSKADTNIHDAVLMKDSTNCEKITDLEEETKTEPVEKEKKEEVHEIQTPSSAMIGRGRRMLERDRVDYNNRSYTRRAQRLGGYSATAINRSETPIRNRFHTLSKYS